MMDKTGIICNGNKKEICLSFMQILNLNFSCNFITNTLRIDKHYIRDEQTSVIDLLIENGIRDMSGSINFAKHDENVYNITNHNLGIEDFDYDITIDMEKIASKINGKKCNIDENTAISISALVFGLISFLIGIIITTLCAWYIHRLLKVLPIC